MKECPEGFRYDREVGACVPIEDDQEDDEEDDQPEVEVSTLAIVATVALIGVVIYAAVKI